MDRVPSAYVRYMAAFIGEEQARRDLEELAEVGLRHLDALEEIGDDAEAFERYMKSPVEDDLPETMPSWLALGHGWDLAFLREDLLAALLRAHLVIEQSFNEALRRILPRPEALGGNLRFHQVVKLLVALGALPREYLRPYLLLNSIRNKCAHEVGREPSADDQDALVQAISQDDAVDTGSPPFPEGLRLALALLVGLAHGFKDSSLATRLTPPGRPSTEGE